jgi:hypothetical protein
VFRVAEDLVSMSGVEPESAAVTNAMIAGLYK